MHYHNLICTCCYAERVPPARAKLGFKTCMTCGERLAKAQAARHTVVNMSKSNYILVTDRSLLKELNKYGNN